MMLNKDDITVLLSLHDPVYKEVRFHNKLMDIEDFEHGQWPLANG